MSTEKPHLPIYTKHRKGKGQFKRKKNHWADEKKNKKIKTKTVKFSDIMKHPNLSLSPKDYIK